MAMPSSYTQVTSFKHSGVNRHGEKFTKKFKDSGTPINMGLTNTAWHPSQIVYGKVESLGRVESGGSFVELGIAIVTTGKGKSKTQHTFNVYRTESVQWTPDQVGFSF